jgi:hypothetical protein
VEGTDFQKSRAFSPAGVTQAGKIVWLAGQTAVTELDRLWRAVLTGKLLKAVTGLMPHFSFPGDFHQLS